MLGTGFKVRVTRPRDTLQFFGVSGDGVCVCSESEADNAYRRDAAVRRNTHDSQ